MVVPCEYDNAWHFSKGLAKVKKNGKYGFVNTQRQLVVPCEYDDAYSFCEGLARVAVGHRSSKYGFVNMQGQLVVPCEYDNARDFHEGLAKVRIGDYDNGKWGFINVQGQLVVPCEYDDAEDFSEGLARVIKNGKEFYINREGVEYYEEVAGSYEETVNGITFRMIPIEGGTFQMGDVFDEGSGDEKPVHEVTLSSYYVAETPVTQALWQAVMGSDPPNLNFKGCDQCPVEQVSWEDIVNEFLPKLNRLTGKSYRLPTEAEWEYAARERGRKVRFGNGKDVADPKEINFNGSASYKQPYSVAGEYRGKTTPVRSFAPNALGLYDMSGNVWEWCSCLSPLKVRSVFASRKDNLNLGDYEQKKQIMEQS